MAADSASKIPSLTKSDWKKATTEIAYKKVGKQLEWIFQNKWDETKLKQGYKAFEQTLAEISKHENKNLTLTGVINYVDNASYYCEFRSLLTASIKFELIEAIKILCKYNVDMNKTIENFAGLAFYLACCHDFSSHKIHCQIMNLLLLNGANPNVLDSEGDYPLSSMISVAGNRNVTDEQLKDLCNIYINPRINNENKYGQYEHPFNWDKLINAKSNSNGLTIIQTFLHYGRIECVKYLLSIDKSNCFNTKLSINCIKKNYSTLCLLIINDWREIFELIINYCNNNIPSFRNDFQNNVLNKLHINDGDDDDWGGGFGGNGELDSGKYYGSLLAYVLDEKITKTTEKEIYWVKNLMKLGINPNNINKNSSIIPIFKKIKSVKTFKLISNESKEFEHSFDWVCFLLLYYVS